MADGDQALRGIPVDGEVKTTDGNATALVSVAIPDNCSAFIAGYFVGQKIGTATSIFAGRAFAVVNATGGAVTIQASSFPLAFKLDPDAKAYSGGFVGVADDVILQVTGRGGENIQWFGSLVILQVEATI